MRVRLLCQPLFSIRSDAAVESYYRSVAALFASLAVTFPDVVKPVISYVTHSQVEDVLNSYGAASQIVSRFRYAAIRGRVPLHPCCSFAGRGRSLGGRPERVPAARCAPRSRSEGAGERREREAVHLSPCARGEGHPKSVGGRRTPGTLLNANNGLVASHVARRTSLVANASLLCNTIMNLSSLWSTGRKSMHGLSDAYGTAVVLKRRLAI